MIPQRDKLLALVKDWRRRGLHQPAIELESLLSAPESAPEGIESLSAKFHEIYQQEARRQGDVRHKDAYADLPENVKEFDRVLARYVLGTFALAASVPECPLPEKWRKESPEGIVGPYSQAVLDCADELESWLRSLAAGGEPRHKVEERKP